MTTDIVLLSDWLKWRTKSLLTLVSSLANHYFDVTEYFDAKKIQKIVTEYKRLKQKEDLGTLTKEEKEKIHLYASHIMKFSENGPFSYNRETEEYDHVSDTILKMINSVIDHPGYAINSQPHPVYSMCDNEPSYLCSAINKHYRMEIALP